MIECDSFVAGNTADQGGGVSVVAGSFLALQDSTTTFKENKANSDGGGMFCASTNKYTTPLNTKFLGVSLFQSNSAYDGGGISVQGLQMLVAELFLGGESSRFEMNQASAGGAISATFYSSLSIQNTSFVANSAEHGGALHLTQSLLLASSCRFNLNVASYSGGGVYASSTNIYFNQSYLLNNTAWNSGGAIALYVDSNMRLMNSSLANNLQTHPLGCMDKCGGGALYAADSTSAEIFNDTSLKGNSADGDGGAILIADMATLYLRKTRTILNSALGYGGGIAISGSAVLTLEDWVIMEGNVANFGGGAIFAAGGTVLMYDVIIRANRAEQIGGGILMYSAVQASSGVEFTGNRAGSGGAVFGSGKNAQLLIGADCSVTFVNNTALGNGGAVYLEDSASYEIEWEACPATCSAIFQGNGVCDSEWLVSQLKSCYLVSKILNPFKCSVML